ncbi:MAG: SIR2 family protein [Ilyomonas sp.]
MNNPAYELLLQKLEDDNCALILGPEFLFADNDDADLVKQIRAFFKDNGFDGAQYLKNDGFFYRIGEANKISEREKLADNLRKFYEEQPMHEYYKMLAELPFRFIINLSPDNYLETAFQKANKPYELVYYQKGDFFRLNREAKRFERIKEEYIPDKNATLILNLLGLYNKDLSLILTYDDFFKSLAPLLNTSNIKLKLSFVLEDVSSFLFLGFKYNKWYLSFIFFLIQHIQGNREFSKKGIVYFTEENLDTFDFYEQAFNFEFNKEKTPDFIKTLYQKCKEEGFITTVSEVAQSNRASDVTQVKRIVYIASNPDILNPVNSDEEYDQIAEITKAFKDSFDLIPTKRASTINDLIDTIESCTPHIVVISAHGNENNELLFKDEKVGMLPLTIDNLSEILKSFTKRSINNLECIIFTCCQSDEFAQKVKNYVQYSIGMQGPLPVEAAPIFLEGFFKSYVIHKNYKDAFANGELYIKQFINNHKELSYIKFSPVMP